MTAKSTAQDIAEYLLSKNVVSLNRTQSALPIITVGLEPDIKDRTIITVYDTYGAPPNPAYQMDKPRFIIRSKSAKPFDQSQAYAIQQAIKDILLGCDSFEINNSLYWGCYISTDTASLSPDINNRPVMVTTYNTIRSYSTTNRFPIS